MMLKATAQSVKGDFTRGRVVLGASLYILQHRNGNYYITESSLSGKPAEHRIEYTLGDRRIQHYLTTLADGRIVILPATWEIARKKWIEDADAENPEEAAGNGFQIWNKSCYGCHVTNEKKNFDVAQLRYRTTWQGFGVGCESCHGPGSEHVATATKTDERSAGWEPPHLCGGSSAFKLSGNRGRQRFPALAAGFSVSTQFPGLKPKSERGLYLYAATLKRRSLHINVGAPTNAGPRTGTENRLPLPTSPYKLHDTIVNPAHLDPARSTMVCAQCHSFRDIYVDGFKAGADYYDFFLPIMEYRLPANSAYWPDGRPRWLANEALALWQSKCFLKGGATCVTCHAQSHDIDIAHGARLRSDSNALCLTCHASIGANLTAHTHHAASSAGSSCIECHMPRSVFSLRAGMRDHTMGIPVPDNTTRHDTPNACNLCHRDKNAEWAAAQMDSWYDKRSRQRLIDRANAFTGARNGDAAAVPLLLNILSDSSEAAFIRANAAGYLGGFPNDPSAYDAVLRLLDDPEPLVRSTAAFAIRPRAAQRAAVAPILVSLLRDPATTVQMSAVIALVGMGVTEAPGEDGEWFNHAKQLYRARAELDSDDAQQQFAAGRFSLLAGDLDESISAFRAALKLDDKIPAKYYLGRALAQKGDSASARQILTTIPSNDQQYSAAQQLLAQIETNATQNQTAQASTAETSGDADFREGQTLYQNGNYGGALKSLDEALRSAPQASWALKAQIYRAVCLEKLGRAQEAEAAIRSLLANPAASQDVDLQLAYVELLYDTGRSADALKQVDQLIAAVPNLPIAYFWRAKILLQLQHVDEAAKAAEESIRLRPDAPEPHNLLMRIYQMQGRTPEATQQAEWLREYQRRIESR